MILKTRHSLVLASLTVAASLLGACGGGKEEAEEPKGGSLEAISKAIESPTGTVSEETVGDVARAFEESNGIPSGGSRDELSPVVAQTQTIACDASGDIAIDAESSGESFTFDYNDCCMTAGCCINGEGEGFMDTSGSGTYLGCYSFDIDYDCDGLSATYDFSYCQSATGDITYSIEIEGDNFAVSGSITNGTGTLTITGENGTWTCDYVEYAGTCTGDGGTFTF